MKLKYMHLKNFRQFKGENKIVFSEDLDKNITVVVGKNTSGKTTLLQSFLWCLYGKANFENDNLLNFKLMEDMKLGDKLEVFVEISLLSEETEYIIKRKCYFNKETNGINTDNSYLDIHYKQDDGQLNRIKSHKTESKINEILPEELSDYFFFDTERIQNISRKKNIKEAVKSLLGLTVLDNAIDHIGNKNKKRSVIGKLYRNLDLENQSEADYIDKNIDRFKQDIEKIDDKIENANKEIEYYSNKVEEYNDILLSNYKTKKLQEKRNTLENKIKSNERSIKNNEENIIMVYLIFY
jgi:DNA sulfur modification protein DndD